MQPSATVASCGAVRLKDAQRAAQTEAWPVWSSSFAFNESHVRRMGSAPARSSWCIVCFRPGEAESLQKRRTPNCPPFLRRFWKWDDWTSGLLDFNDLISWGWMPPESARFRSRVLDRRGCPDD